jgi:hypothetical protein
MNAYHRSYTFKEITKILVAKYPTPPPTKQSNVGKTIKSKEIIEDSNDEEEG